MFNIQCLVLIPIDKANTHSILICRALYSWHIPGFHYCFNECLNTKVIVTLRYKSNVSQDKKPCVIVSDKEIAEYSLIDCILRLDRRLFVSISCNPNKEIWQIAWYHGHQYHKSVGLVSRFYAQRSHKINENLLSASLHNILQTQVKFL